MAEIARKPGFLPEATWLAVYVGPRRRAGRSIAAPSRGSATSTGWGAIQNLGIAPEHRDARPGHRSAAARALAGFRQAGVQRVYLEVTAQNEGAIRLYRRVGIRHRQDRLQGRRGGNTAT